MSLATDLRPRKLGDLIGQHVAADTAEGFLKVKIPSAILISGPYGTGKTTLARLLGSYLNCVHGPASVCAEREGLPRLNDSTFRKELTAKELHHANDPCPSCALFNGHDPQHPDYRELNCGDSRGIDVIRELVSASSLFPRFNRRVIVLDEAQELTKQAASALLKPIEEPAPSTVWIIVTTDREKILPTIQSRCTELRLKPVTDEDLLQLLRATQTKIGKSFTDAILKKIAEVANGHPRDAIKGLEAAAAYATKNANLNEDKLMASVEETLSANSAFAMPKFLSAIINAQPSAVHLSKQTMDSEGLMVASLSGIDNILGYLAGSRTDTQIARIVDSCKREMSLVAQGPDLVALRQFFLRGIAESRQGFRASEALTAATVEALAVTSKWNKVT